MTGMRAGGDGRVADRIALGVLARVFPADLIDEVVAGTGRGEVRRRKLPARVVVYFVLAMCLFRLAAYEEVARADTVGAWYRQWRLVAVDGTALEVPDTTVNAEYFGRAVSDRGAGAFPQVRMVALAECGTHAVFGVAMSPFTVSEVALVGQLWGLDPGFWTPGRLGS